MQVRLKPYHKNLYNVNSLLICGETVLDWITAICKLNIELHHVEVYAVPGTKANTLYGCVLFFKSMALPKDIRNHQYLQYAADKLLLPEQSIYLPAVDEEELQLIEPGKKILLHPVVGTVVLDEPVNWEDLLVFEEAASAILKKPVAGVFIPGNINAYTLELSDEKLINALLNPPSQKELMEQLPFDVQKLMKGNKREMEKYLKYLEMHPDKALDIALPLDVMGSFRGDNKGRFSFSGNWMQRLFGSNYAGSRRTNTASGSANFWWIGLVGVALFKIMTCNSVTDTNIDYPVPKMSFTIQHQTVLDSHYNSIMASKNTALLKLLANKPDAAEKYREASLKTKESGKIILDSLTVMYTAITKTKTDSVIKQWKKFAADSIKKNYGKKNFQHVLATTVAKKKEKVYKDYAVYYGISTDSSLVRDWYQQTNMTEQPVKKTERSGNNNTGYTFLFTLVLIGVALFIVYVQAPQTAEGKISAGQGEMSLGRILLLMTIMTVSIIYIMQPLLENYGFGWLSMSVCMILLLLLYRLFGKGLTIFKLDNE